MMKILRLCVLGGLFSLVAAVSLPAQFDIDESNPLAPAAQPPRIYVGPIAGFNQNFHSGGFTSFVLDVQCPNFTSGNATGFYGGFSMEYLLGDPKDARSSILARLTYDNRPASFSEGDEEYPTRILDNGLDTTVITSVEHSAEITYDLIGLDILYKLMLGNTKVGVMVGPTVGYVMSANVEQFFKLLKPLEGQFVPEPGPYEYRDNNRTIVINDGDVPDAATLRIGIKVGVLYELSLRKLIVAPHIFYDFGITKVTSNENWRVNAFQAGVDVRFAL